MRERLKDRQTERQRASTQRAKDRQHFAIPFPRGKYIFTQGNINKASSHPQNLPGIRTFSPILPFRREMPGIRNKVSPVHHMSEKGKKGRGEAKEMEERNVSEEIEARELRGKERKGEF